MFHYPRFQNFADSLLNILMVWADTPAQRAEITDLVHKFENRSWDFAVFEQAVQEVGEPFEVTPSQTTATPKTVKMVVTRYLELNQQVLLEEEDNE